MSGFLVSTGMLTNNGEKLEKGDIIDIMKSKIENISVQIIPLKDTDEMKTVKDIGKVLQNVIHPVFTPTLSHISIQMTLENNLYAIIEYGQYFTKDSDEIKKRTQLFNQIF